MLLKRNLCPLFPSNQVLPLYFCKHIYSSDKQLLRSVLYCAFTLIKCHLIIVKPYFDFIVFTDFISEFPRTLLPSEGIKYHYHFMQKYYSIKIPKARIYSHPEIRGLISWVMNLGFLKNLLARLASAQSREVGYKFNDHASGWKP